MKTIRILQISVTISIFIIFSRVISAQAPLPSASLPSAPIVVSEKTLSNGLAVAVAERRTSPLVSVDLLIKSGADAEKNIDQAGLAEMTANLLTKGATARNRTQTAERVEFLGTSFDTAVSQNASVIGFEITNDKTESGLQILAEIYKYPTFSIKEINLLRKQMIDGLTYELKQPSFIAEYSATINVFQENPLGGTKNSLKKISTAEIKDFYRQNYKPENSVLIFSGDIDSATAFNLAEKYFGNAKNSIRLNPTVPDIQRVHQKETDFSDRILFVDMPGAEQVAINYSVKIEKSFAENDNDYYAALIFDSILGGGYSSRLNREIRIERGLSYGVESDLSLRKNGKANFSIDAQTKNESAAEVAALILNELKSFEQNEISNGELNSRRQTLIGQFARETETVSGLGTILATYFAFDRPIAVLNNRENIINAVSPNEVKKFNREYIKDGILTIVGDYKKIKDSLSEKFPDARLKVVSIDLYIEK